MGDRLVDAWEHTFSQPRGSNTKQWQSNTSSPTTRRPAYSVPLDQHQAGSSQAALPSLNSNPYGAQKSLPNRTQAPAPRWYNMVEPGVQNPRFASSIAAAYHGNLTANEGFNQIDLYDHCPSDMPSFLNQKHGIPLGSRQSNIPQTDFFHTVETMDPYEPWSVSNDDFFTRPPNSIVSNEISSRSFGPYPMQSQQMGTASENGMLKSAEPGRTSHLRVPADYYRSQHSKRREKLKQQNRTRTSQGNSPENTCEGPPPMAQPQILSDIAIKACQLWISQSPNRHPSQEEICGLSVAFKASKELLYDWFWSQPSLHPTEDSGYHTATTSEPNAALEYRKNQRKCKQGSQRPPNDGQYACTSGCGARFKKKDGWKKHEELNWPQEVWLCPHDDCRRKPVGKRVRFRKDKFRDHLKKHGYNLDAEEMDLEVSRIRIESEFSKSCNFKGCTRQFNDWKGRINHIAKHLEEPWDESQWIDHGIETTGVRDSTSVKSGRSTGVDVESGTEIDPDVNASTDAEESDLGSDSDASDDEDEDDNDSPSGSSKGPRDGDRGGGSGGAGGHHYSHPWRHHPNGSSDNQDESGSTDFSQYLGPSPTYSRHSLQLSADLLCHCSSSNSETSRSKLTSLAILSTPKGSDTELGHKTLREGKDLNFRSLRRLGSSATAIVDEIQCEGSQRTLARKQISCLRRAHRNSIYREADIMKRLQHPHIVRLVTSYTKDNSVTIIMEPAADYSLSQYLYIGSSNGQEAWHWFGCLSSGLKYMHENGVRHGDIKPSNILIKDEHVLYADFGLSNLVSDDDSNVSGSWPMTKRYAAPEALSGRRGRAYDIWSLGCVFLEIITFLLHQSIEDMYKPRPTKQIRCMRDESYSNNLEAVSDWISRLRQVTPSCLKSDVFLILDLCEVMMDPEPKNRPNAANIAEKLVYQSSCLQIFKASTQNENKHRHSVLQKRNLSESAVRRKFPGWTMLEIWLDTLDPHESFKAGYEARDLGEHSNLLISQLQDIGTKFFPNHECLPPDGLPHSKSDFDTSLLARNFCAVSEQSTSSDKKVDDTIQPEASTDVDHDMQNYMGLTLPLVCRQDYITAMLYWGLHRIYTTEQYADHFTILGIILEAAFLLLSTFVFASAPHYPSRHSHTASRVTIFVINGTHCSLFWHAAIFYRAYS